MVKIRPIFTPFFRWSAQIDGYTKSADNQVIDYQPILFGATQGVRTLDLRITNALLYQLS